MRPIVIIDGNNLAHQKYTFEGRDVPINVFERMISELEFWAKSENCLVELCLDPCPVECKATEYVSIYIENKKADDLVEERALYRTYEGVPCFVVTLDDELSDTVRSLGVHHIYSSDFTQRSGEHGFMTLPLFNKVKKILPDQEPVPVNQKNTQIHQKQHKKLKSSSNQSELGEIHKRTLQHANLFEVLSEEGSEIISPETHYSIDVVNWPVKKGIEFILESACREHQNTLRDLIGDTSQATQEDLLILFKEWSECCQTESDFVSRGGSLMDRVRLLLIKNHPQVLTLAQIKNLAGGNISGLNKKIWKYSPGWITEVVFPDTKIVK